MSKESKTSKPKSAFSLFPESSKLVQKHFAQFAVLFIVPLVSSLYFALRTVPALNTGTFDLKAYTGLTAWQWAIFIVISVVVQTAITGFSLRAAQGKKTSWGELWDIALEYTFPLIGLGIVSALIVVLGFVCFIVPGLIMLRRVLLAPYVLIDQKVGIVESLRRSADMSKPFSRSIWGVLGVMILLQVPGLQPFGPVGAILATVLGLAYTVAPALRYVELKKLTS